MGTFQALSENAMGGFTNESPLATQKTAIGGTENQRCGHKSSHNFRISCPNPDFLSDPESPGTVFCASTSVTNQHLYENSCTQKKRL